VKEPAPAASCACGRCAGDGLSGDDAQARGHGLLAVGRFLFVLLFPFYWMVMTALKPNEELLSHEGNPFWVHRPTLVHVKKLLFDTAYPDWLWNTVLVSVVATFLSLVASVLAAYAIERLRFRGARYVGMSIFLAYLVPRRSCSFRSRPWLQAAALRHASGADTHVPDLPIRFAPGC